MSKRSQKALDRAIEQAQERHRRNWNAMVKRQENAERKRQAEQKPAKLRSVK